MVYVGVVENRDDPLKLGRCQVRVVGLHNHDKNELPTAELPWAYPVQPVTSAGINGIGWTPLGPVPGSWVVILFQDADNQMPIMLGSIGGIPQSRATQKMSLNGARVTTGQEVPLGAAAEEELAGLSAALGIKLGNAVGELLGGGTVGNTIGQAIGSIFGRSESSAPQAKLETIEKENEKPIIVPAKVDPTPHAIAPDAQSPSGNPAAASAQTLATPILPKVLKKYLPKGATESSANKYITAILKACDEVGYTSKYAKAAILGIAGGESGWHPVEEAHYFSTVDRLMKVFPSVFRGKPDLAAQYVQGKKSKAEFFKLVYSPDTPNGRGLGNTKPDDGKYYGRGFIQITGRPNYTAASKQLESYGYPKNSLLDKPELLITDARACALACVLYYKSRVKIDQADPGFFNAALAATGRDVGNGYKHKTECYQHFLGEGVIPASTNKGPVTENTVPDKEEVKYLPPSKQAALTEERPDVVTTGFQDPSGKYPLRQLLDEPDTNRLARGIIKETAVEFKDATRARAIPMANDEDANWSQPLAAFGGVYPYSKVYESESGHLMIFDDSPGYENVSLYHRKGSFIDFDANGTAVHKIVGDGYVIMDRNGFITIEGQCAVHIGGNANIMVEGNTDLQVNGRTTANFHSTVDIGCAADVNWAVGGNFNLTVGGDCSTVISGKNTSTITGASSTYVTGEIQIDGGAGFAIQSVNATTIKTPATINLNSGGEFSVKADSAIKIQSASVVNVKSGGTIKLDGSNISTQVGGAAAANTLEGFEKTVPVLLSAPAWRGASGKSFDVLQTPVRPSPQIIVKQEILDDYNAKLNEFEKNPNKSYNKDSETAEVSKNVRPQPDIKDAGQSMKSGGEPTDLAAFLSKQLDLSKDGYWTERGMKDKSKSNPNIMAMWRDIGMASVAQEKGDQTAWCMAFVNWTLKQCGYRYVQSARAYDIRDKPERWGAKRVTDPEPGDICVWNFSHVNFVYTVENGKCTFVGGNQGEGKPANNPAAGRVTISYPNGVPKNHGSIVGFYRPSKV